MKVITETVPAVEKVVGYMLTPKEYEKIIQAIEAGNCDTAINATTNMRLYASVLGSHSYHYAKEILNALADVFGQGE